MPTAIRPQLATAAKLPPAHGNWTYQIKFDGYRMLARIDRGDIRLHTKNGHDWTARLPRLREALGTLGARNAWLDGEIVVLNAAGRPDFNALQNAFDRRRTAEIVLFVFDLLWLDDVDLRPQPLRERRARLVALLEDREGPVLRLAEDFSEDPHTLLASARRMRLEGLMGKRLDAPYRSGRGTDWIKLKTGLRQELVIGGFIRLKGAAAGVHSLLLGVHELDGSLRYAGRVQPYLSPSKAAAFYRQALPLARPAPPFSSTPWLERGRDYYWVQPELVCEVSFVEWTPGGEIRHPVFHALREDKPAREIVAETPIDVAASEAHAQGVSAHTAATPRGAPVVCGMRISNPGRIVDASAGHTKLEVVRYYEAIAEWALPYLHNRPLSVVRAPEGIAGELFFQKHAEQSKIPGVEELSAELHPGHQPLLVANTR